jgi:hypothetical protein
MKLVQVSLRTHESRIDCQADRLLYNAETSRLYLVSLVGADSAVRAMLAALSGHSSLEAKIVTTSSGRSSRAPAGAGQTP